MFKFRFYAYSNFFYKGYNRTNFKQVDGRIELAESAILQPNNEDLVRLERIHEFWAKGERRLKVITPAVWCDVAGWKLSIPELLKRLGLIIGD